MSLQPFVKKADFQVFKLWEEFLSDLKNRFYNDRSPKNQIKIMDVKVWTLLVWSQPKTT